MTKRNLCDTCLHRHVCRHSTDPAGRRWCVVLTTCAGVLVGPIELVPMPTQEDEK